MKSLQELELELHALPRRHSVDDPASDMMDAYDGWPTRAALTKHFRARMPRYEQVATSLEGVALHVPAGKWADDAHITAQVVYEQLAWGAHYLGRRADAERWWARADDLARQFLAACPRPTLEEWTLRVSPVEEHVAHVLRIVGVGPVTEPHKACRYYARVGLIVSLQAHGKLGEARAELGRLMAEGLPEDRAARLRRRCRLDRRKKE
jgi:hypothetical protein